MLKQNLKKLFRSEYTAHPSKKVLFNLSG